MNSLKALQQHLQHVVVIWVTLKDKTFYSSTKARAVFCRLSRQTFDHPILKDAVRVCVSHLAYKMLDVQSRKPQWRPHQLLFNPKTDDSTDHAVAVYGDLWSNINRGWNLTRIRDAGYVVVGSQGTGQKFVHSVMVEA